MLALGFGNVCIQVDELRDDLEGFGPRFEYMLWALVGLLVQSLFEVAGIIFCNVGVISLVRPLSLSLLSLSLKVSQMSSVWAHLQ